MFKSYFTTYLISKVIQNQHLYFILAQNHLIMDFCVIISIIFQFIF